MLEGPSLGLLPEQEGRPRHDIKVQGSAEAGAAGVNQFMAGSWDRTTTWRTRRGPDPALLYGGKRCRRGRSPAPKMAQPASGPASGGRCFLDRC